MNALDHIAYEWAVRCFGEEHIQNIPVRALRFAEEAVELGQCCGVTAEQMHRLVDVVYSRPEGRPYQEIGGCMVTLSVLCTQLGHSYQAEYERELRRILAKSPEHFAGRNKEKLELGLTG